MRVLSKKIILLKLENSETGESAEICPDLGGTIRSLTLGKELHQILAGDREEEFLQNPLFRGRILFPFNDRIPDGKYQFSGKEYQLPVNSIEDRSAIHGFIYNKKVTVLDQKKDSITLFWHTGRNQIRGYPFDISLKTDIALRKGGLKISFTVENRGNIPAPFALGWHSYFNADQDSVLHADYPGYFKTDNNFLPVGGTVPASGSEYDFSRGEKFLGKNLDHTFLVPADRTSVIINKDYSIKIKQSNFAYTQLFIPRDRKSIAVEPISSKPNSFNTDAVLTLKPGEEYKAGIEIRLETDLLM